MAGFNKFILTNSGTELLNRVIAEGKTLKFTKFEIGENKNTDIKNSTELSAKFKEFNILECRQQKEGYTSIKGFFDNKDMTTSKKLTEIGIFAQLGDEVLTETLFSYSSTVDDGETIPDNSTYFSRTISALSRTDDVTSITFEVSLMANKTEFSNVAMLQASTHLQVGDIVDIQGYYTAGDGAHHKRKIAVSDDGSGVQLTNGLWANIVHNGEVNVSWFGAKGDGATDDTATIEKALILGTNLVLQEKTYLIKKELFVNVQKMSIRGLSGRSKLLCATDFVGENCITFYNSDLENSWSIRQNRINEHGNFTIKHLNSENTCNGINTAGAKDSDKEGHTDEQIYKNIFIDNFNGARIVYGSHNYKCIFMNISGRNGSPLKSEVGQFDAGEVTLFLNCSFWDSTAGIDVSRAATFSSCTFHGDSHIFGGGESYQMTNCHFERIGLPTTRPFFMKVTGNSKLSICGCVGIASHVNTPFNNLFVAEQGSNIVITNSNLKYFLSRISCSEFYFKGDVRVDGVDMMFNFESNSIVGKYLYDNVKKDFTLGAFEESYYYYAGAKKQNPTFEVLPDKTVRFTFSDYKHWEHGQVLGIGKIIECSNKKGLNYISKVIINTEGISHQFQNNNSGYCIVFLDGSKTPISDITNSNIYKKTDASTVGTIVETKYYMSIPNNCKYIWYGVTCVANSKNNITFDVERCSIELV